MLIFAYGKNLRKLLSREAGINRRNAPNQLLNSSTTRYQFLKERSAGFAFGGIAAFFQK